ncbi:MAG: hypothetical protein KDC35_07460 [Acidobacteria bacterium]|nr:hypothetical protein [Acidobacteriota bacterium]
MKSMGWILFVTSCLAMAQNDYFVGDSHTLMQIRGGWFEPQADGELYDFVEEELTFDRNRLDGISFDINIYRQLNNYVSLGGGVTGFGDSVSSEYRDFTFEDGDSITQTTRLDQTWVGFLTMITPFGAGSYYGSRAWAPKAVVPYLVLGAGVVQWEFSQEGDFVDVDTLDVFYDSFFTEGSTPSLRGALGIRVNLSKNIDLDIATTYDVAEDDVGDDFQGFGDIQLDAQHTSAGINLRF